jgi:UDP-2,4-diacetamido-2,4,6-trideoxy-beta-L-altropyranose hydrolase
MSVTRYPTVLFRVDASLDIGTGHVMRCLTLADALRERGADCRFICREHPGNLLHLIRERGYTAHGLPVDCGEPTAGEGVNRPQSPHAAWLGTDWKRDAEQTRAVLGGSPVDWLVVDHYALDGRWESTMRQICRRLMVIDDLADRVHECDLLLDQNLGRLADDYSGLVPGECELLVGPKYALLRPEFASLREYSLKRRVEPQLKRLLISLGGVDKNNVTADVLEAIRACTLPEAFRITIVMGPHAPWLEQVRATAGQLPWETEVLVDVRNMAELMAESDLAIGAAGSTSWERCTMGLPTLLLVLARNQVEVTGYLSKAGAAECLDYGARLQRQLCEQLASLAVGSEGLAEFSRKARSVCDGAGASRVVGKLQVI